MIVKLHSKKEQNGASSIWLQWPCAQNQATWVIFGVFLCPPLRGTVPHFQDFSSVLHIETLSHIVTWHGPSVFKCPNSYSPLIVDVLL